ncbi:MAG: helix-turn-helix transcriptional regulator [Deltaproteobacteria bacterium]|nr:helix-turn-helix transcriptional regulator [Deltaproteobacteria bacterium]
MDRRRGGEREPQAQAESAFGQLLRQWRARRHTSQLALAVEAEISSRHLSFLETGRAQPSRDMVSLLARVLDVPLRARNELLTAAGYAPIYRETALDETEMAQVRRAVDFMLYQQEPYPAVVLDRLWNIVKSNDAMGRVMRLFLSTEEAAAAGAPNIMRLTYHPRGLRTWIVNWEETASAYIQWLHRDLLRTGDPKTGELLDELLSYPGIPRQWLSLDLDASTNPFLAMEFRKGNVRLRFFTTIASLGTPYDITLHELRVECFFPAEEATEAALHALVPLVKR